MHIFITQDKSISEIYAIDRDEPCTENTEIDYSIQNTTDPNGNLIKETEIFTIETIKKDDADCTHYGVLKTAKPLKGFYGEFTVAIRVRTHTLPLWFSILQYL